MIRIRKKTNKKKKTKKRISRVYKIQYKIDKTKNNLEECNLKKSKLTEQKMKNSKKEF